LQYTACINIRGWSTKHLILMGWMMGFEPTTTGITIRDSTTELHPPLKPLACPTGLEPVTLSLEG
jgi:hypothetical protein